MHRLTGRYTNFYRDKEAWTGTLVTGGSPTTMAEAVAEIVALAQTAPDLVYWSTIVEHDGPDGDGVVSTVDLGAYVRDVLDLADPGAPGDEEVSGEVSGEMPGAARHPARQNGMKRVVVKKVRAA